MKIHERRRVELAISPCIAQKARDLVWLSSVLSGKYDSFPFTLHKAATNKIETLPVRSKFCKKFPHVKVVTHLTTDGPLVPHFLLMLPCKGEVVINPSKENCNLFRMLSLIDSEVFQGSCFSEERQKAYCVVMAGLNYPRTLDRIELRRFRQFVSRLKAKSRFELRITAFFWNLQYNATGTGCGRTAEGAFYLLSLMDRKVALALKKELHSKVSAYDLVPYRRIRQTLIRAEQTEDLCVYHQTSGRKSYVVTLDADAGRIANEGEGLIPYFIELARQRYQEVQEIPDVMSPGYCLDPSESYAARVAIQFDMAVREQMNEVLPGSIYFPEPCTAFTYHHDLTFLPRMGDQTAESRRLIESGVASGVFRREHMVFQFSPLVQTALPARMVTKTMQKKSSVKKVQELFEKQMLEAYRSLSQSHVDLQNRAQQIYGALGIRVSQVFDVKAPIKAILKIFCPITFCYTSGTLSGRYASIRAIKHLPLFERFAIRLWEWYAEPQKKTVSFQDEWIETLFRTHAGELDANIKKLRAQATLSDEHIDAIIRTAFHTGHALFHAFLEIVSSK
ncbi:MAG: hypothetical protein A3F09_05625 [Chlamydiae bacterium RIFCSPHIGHO2_12_FULL_49_11]|nr:MAG: hypothetical protein A3F09_05625 [Chlamydiae bacterium RIFCSPHIGHO2_12_FULL_49_11]